MRSPENQSLKSRETGLGGSALFAIFNFGTAFSQETSRGYKPGRGTLGRLRKYLDDRASNVSSRVGRRQEHGLELRWFGDTPALSEGVEGAVEITVSARYQAVAPCVETAAVGSSRRSGQASL